MSPTDKKERDKRHVRSLQNPRIVADFRLCNVSIAEADRAELLGMICWLITGKDAFKQPKRKQQTTRETDGQHERHTNVS